jgi:hypothetical protein
MKNLPIFAKVPLYLFEVSKTDFLLLRVEKRKSIKIYSKRLGN